MSKTTEPLSAELNPVQQLAASIAQELVTQELAAEEKKGLLATKLATGQMKAEDWRTLMAASLQTSTSSKGGEA